MIQEAATVNITSEQIWRAYSLPPSQRPFKEYLNGSAVWWTQMSHSAAVLKHERTREHERIIENLSNVIGLHFQSTLKLWKSTLRIAFTSLYFVTAYMCMCLIKMQEISKWSNGVFPPRYTRESASANEIWSHLHSLLFSSLHPLSPVHLASKAILVVTWHFQTLVPVGIKNTTAL